MVSRKLCKHPSAYESTFPSLHIVERCTLVDRQTLDYQLTIDDPQAYTAPWKISSISFNGWPAPRLQPEAAY